MSNDNDVLTPEELELLQLIQNNHEYIDNETQAKLIDNAGLRRCIPKLLRSIFITKMGSAFIGDPESMETLNKVPYYPTQKGLDYLKHCGGA